jgi:S1-C subfamily serine protease
MEETTTEPKIFVWHQNRQQGPFSVTALIGAIKVGRFSDTSPACTDQDQHLRPLSHIIEEYSSKQPIPQPSPLPPIEEDSLPAEPASEKQEQQKVNPIPFYIGGVAVLLIIFTALFFLSKHYNKSRDLLNTEELYAKVAPCCVRIRTQTKGSKGHGSGFFFKEGGYILTSNHVIENGTIEVVTSEGIPYKCQILAQSKEYDLAVIKINLEDHNILQLGTLDSVKTGAPVALVGYPILDSGTSTMNSGTVSNTSLTPYGIPCFQLDVTVNRGNSGGPVTLKNGRAIGILAFKFRDPDIDRFNFAVRIDVIKEFLNDELGFSFPEI